MPLVRVSERPYCRPRPNQAVPGPIRIRTPVRAMRATGFLALFAAWAPAQGDCQAYRVLSHLPVYGILCNASEFLWLIVAPRGSPSRVFLAPLQNKVPAANWSMAP
jgi:hypothetical protein